MNLTHIIYTYKISFVIFTIFKNFYNFMLFCLFCKFCVRTCLIAFMIFIRTIYIKVPKPLHNNFKVVNMLFYKSIKQIFAPGVRRLR